MCGANIQSQLCIVKINCRSSRLNCTISIRSYVNCLLFSVNHTGQIEFEANFSLQVYLENVKSSLCVHGVEAPHHYNIFSESVLYFQILFIIHVTVLQCHFIYNRNQASYWEYSIMGFIIFSHDLCCRALLRLVEDESLHGAVLRVQPKGCDLVEFKEVGTPIDI